MAAKPIPDTYPAVVAMLVVRGADKAIAFYRDILGARERLRISMPDGSIGHAELEIGRDGLVMLAEESPRWNALSPAAFGGSPVSMMVYVEDADATVARAVAAGARLETPVETHFYGDRSGRITDPFGHTWHIATHVEDMSREEMQRRCDALFGASHAG
jgi:PhnB protein